MKKVILPLFIFLMGLFFWNACETDIENPPENQTNKITINQLSIETISYFSAKIIYNTSNLECNNNQSYGLCYNETGNPTPSDKTVLLNDSSGVKTVDNLLSDTEYYIRLYVKFSDAVLYSDELVFNTLVTGKPIVNTHDVTHIDETSASSGGYVRESGGFPITSRGVCWSNSPNPTVNDNHTNDGSGLGKFDSEISGLNQSSTYYLRAYATNSEGTAYGVERSFVAMVHMSGSFTDYRDEKKYDWVRIGGQVWMEENLNYDQDSYGNDWCYENNSSNCNTYGRLYDWYAVMQGANSSGSNPSGVQGVCPDGWHLPSDEEWKELEMQLGMSQSQADNTEYRGTNEGSKLAGNASLWDSGDLINDSEFGTSGFTALPGGTRGGSSFYDIEFSGFWWSSTEYSSSQAWIRSLNSNYNRVRRAANDKDYGISVRCVRDE
jgi:uncharacterized protein (TIGR02145 family)